MIWTIGRSSLRLLTPEEIAQLRNERKRQHVSFRQLVKQFRISVWTEHHLYEAAVKNRRLENYTFLTSNTSTQTLNVYAGSKEAVFEGVSNVHLKDPPTPNWPLEDASDRTATRVCLTQNGFHSPRIV